MATTPTNKPIPSEEPRDLKFNAGKIDEVVTSDAHYYTDRFGVRRWTIAGFQYTAEEAIRNYGYITIDSFEDGTTLTLPNQVLRYEATGEYYRWDGEFPKAVPAGSTPASTGGVGLGAWVSVGDAALRGELDSTNGELLIGKCQTIDDLRVIAIPHDSNRTVSVMRHSNKTSKYIGVYEYDPSSVSEDNNGSVISSVHGGNWLFTGEITPFLFGAVGDGVHDDTASIQAAINATPLGGRLNIPTPPVYYNCTSELSINKPIAIEGTGGSCVYKQQMPCLKFPTGVNGFVLRPTENGYRFEYGISGVLIRNIMLEGQAVASSGWAGYAISVDESVNSGTYHVRDCSFENVHIRYFDHAIRLRGTVYLNNFIGVRALWNGVGVRIDGNDAGVGYSDQNRFFGCEFVLNKSGMILSAVRHAGSQTIHGCTISENTVQGITVGYNTMLSIVGNTIEKNPIGFQILIPAGVTNPASECAKVISGNWFLANTVAIKVIKSTTSLTSGFAFPLLIQGNSFNQTTNEVLRVEAPTGAAEFDSKQFILCSSNSYSNVGEVSVVIPDSKISAGWAGYNGFHEDGKVTISARVSGNVVTNAGFFIVPANKQCYVKYDCLSIPTLASSGRTQTPCNIKFMNVNTPGSPTVIHQGDSVRNGVFTIPRQASALRVSIDMQSDASGNTAMAEIKYCIF